MMEFAGEIGKTMAESKLSELAKEVPVSKLDFKELDKPLQFDESKVNDSNLNETAVENLNQEKKGLNKDEKNQIKEESGWSDEIIDAIGSMEEYEIYKDAGLKEMEIDGKKVLMRDDIDFEQKDSMGRTNKERMNDGLSPINKDGEKIELHHIGQKSDSPLAELTMKEHRGSGNDGILHEKTKESEIDRNKFNAEKEKYWEKRSDGGSNNE